VRLACLSHAASVHCEPGSNSSIICRIRRTRALRPFPAAHFKLEGLPIGKFAKNKSHSCFQKLDLPFSTSETVAKKFIHRKVTQSIKVIAL
jgi:hypothetical protein